MSKRRTRLSAKFADAAKFAVRAHGGQIRKGSGTPYISHPFAVASLVLEYGGDEDQAIAALLHDVIEDSGVSQARLTRSFGARPAQIVADCSDYFGPKGGRKPAWRERKEKYIKHLNTVHASTLLVSAADKLHNARAITHDVRHYGHDIWSRFSAPPLEIAWYYRSLLTTYHRRSRAERNLGLHTILTELTKVIEELSRAARQAHRGKTEKISRTAKTVRSLKTRGK